MSHTKHSNTIFPGDKVRVIGNSLNKIAANEEGTVQAGDVGGMRVYVRFPDGRKDVVELDKLEKVE